MLSLKPPICISWQGYAGLSADL